jgi:hypothetical protein
MRWLLLIILLLCALPLQAASTINGIYGKPYRPGVSQPIRFTLQRATYMATRLVAGGRIFAPTAEQKLLLLHFSVHNAASYPVQIYQGIVRFRAVDGDGNTYKPIDVWGISNGAGAALGLNHTLNPGKSAHLYTAIFLPAAGAIEHLTILPEFDEPPAIRYDLRGNIKGLAAPYVDPDDDTNSTALATMPATVGATYSLGWLDVKVLGISYTSTPLGIYEEVWEDMRILVVRLWIKNASLGAHQIFREKFRLSLLTEGDYPIAWQGGVTRTNSTEEANFDLKKGGDAQVLLYAMVPADRLPHTLTLCELYPMEGVGNALASRALSLDLRELP